MSSAKAAGQCADLEENVRFDSEENVNLEKTIPKSKELHAKRLQDQEDAFKAEREAFVLLEQELAKCMANLHHGEHDSFLLLKNEACLELEDNLHRNTEEMDVLQHRCARLQQELDDVQRTTAAESCERESMKVNWEGEVESLKDKCADLEEKVRRLSQESEASKESLSCAKSAFGNGWSNRS